MSKENRQKRQKQHLTLWLAKIIFPFEIPAEWFMPKEKDKKTTKKDKKDKITFCGL